MTRHVRFITLGCKVNQYETQGMREALGQVGIQEPRFSPEDSEENTEKSQDRSAVDFVVINTCTVTQKADRENFYWIRRAHREHPNAKIVVTGCFVERNRKEVEAVPEVDLVLANHEKSQIVDRLTLGCADPSPTPLPENGERDRVRGKDSRHLRHHYSSLSVSRSQGNGRAFLKIQDGCNHACSFCKVVLVRGRSRSRQLSDIVEEAKRLSDSGYREMVLTGIQLGAYGLDLEPGAGLVDVIEACSTINGIERIRLSSIEPTDVKPSLIEALRTISKCCPHLHIPLQSGDDTVLRSMNRRYQRSFYIDLIERLKSQIPNFSLTLDVMAGFPGEEEAHFQKTQDLLEKVLPLKCHVFPYSKRDGTRAAHFRDIEDPIIRDRVNRLIQLGDRLGREVRLAYTGQKWPVLVEKATGQGRLLQGLTPNYLKVCFQGERDWVGQIVWVELLTLQGDVFLGKTVERDKG